jgi:hypothetical protein
VRPCGPAKQRLRLGSNPDRGCCRESATYPASDSYATSNGHSVRARKPNADADNNAPTANANSYGYSYDTTIPNAYAYTYSDGHSYSSAKSNPEASPDSASATVSAPDSQ